MITGEVKQTEVIVALEIGSKTQDELAIKTKKQKSLTGEENAADIQTAERFSRLKKSARKKSASIL